MRGVGVWGCEVWGVGVCRTGRQWNGVVGMGLMAGGAAGLCGGLCGGLCVGGVRGFLWEVDF